MNTTVTHSRQRGRFVSFILEAAKLVGIAIICLLVIAAVVIFSARAGIKVPERWIGLAFWTCFLLWFVFRQHRRDLGIGRFWLALSAFLIVHFTIFVVVLRAYPAWRPIWFAFVIMIEAPPVLASFERIVRPRSRRNPWQPSPAGDRSPSRSPIPLARFASSLRPL